MRDDQKRLTEAEIVTMCEYAIEGETNPQIAMKVCKTDMSLLRDRLEAAYRELDLLIPVVDAVMHWHEAVDEFEENVDDVTCQKKLGEAEAQLERQCSMLARTRSYGG